MKIFSFLLFPRQKLETNFPTIFDWWENSSIVSYQPLLENSASGDFIDEFFRSAVIKKSQLKYCARGRRVVHQECQALLQVFHYIGYTRDFLTLLLSLSGYTVKLKSSICNLSSNFHVKFLFSILISDFKLT